MLIQCNWDFVIYFLHLAACVCVCVCVCVDSLLSWAKVKQPTRIFCCCLCVIRLLSICNATMCDCHERTCNETEGLTDNRWHCLLHMRVKSRWVEERWTDEPRSAELTSWCFLKEWAKLTSNVSSLWEHDLSQGAMVFIDSDNYSMWWRSRVQDSIGGSSEKFPSNQDSGSHKIIPVRAKWFGACDTYLSNSVKD